MATIDNLDLNVHNLYAVRTRLVEQINQQWRLDQASYIPPQTHVVDILPKPAEIDILMGMAPFIAPWAYFYPPKRFRRQRRSPFSFFRIVPLLGSLDDQEEQEEQLAKTPCHSPEEEEEKRALVNCLVQIRNINSWIGHIIGRIGQFLQG